ncbi:hypothetical protein [Paenibacillus hamazuiensis]|uniref:hypothetical protein n=1 Tax=Paenibacillus hamazuiensis TaxID=2936508 RepID=UPI00200FCAAB|nr:hypothetical protein [Paenibacillus hamazuiensis]
MLETKWLEQLIETWYTNNRINLFLLEKIGEEGLDLSISKRGGGTPAKQLAHIHNMRCDKLNKWHPALAEGLRKLSMSDRLGKALLTDCLTVSGEHIAEFIGRCAHGDIEYRGFKKGLVTSISYLIAHESHHRGNLLLNLKLCGFELDKAAQYAIWNWDNM